MKTVGKTKVRSSRPVGAHTPATSRRAAAVSSELEALRRRNEELEATCVRGEQAEHVLHARSVALAERVKELSCLYSVSALVEQHHTPLGAILDEIVSVLPSAWQYPEVTCSRLRLRGEPVHVTTNFRADATMLREPIVVRGDEIGVLEVGYLEARPARDEGPFLAEERRLLSAVGERVADLVDLKATDSKLVEYQQQLRSLAAQLTVIEERERREIASCLHDRVGQTLAVALIKLQAARQTAGKGALDRQLEDVCGLVKQAVDDTRSLTFEISPPILYELGLVPALGWLAEDVERRCGLPVALESHVDGLALDDETAVILFRAVQELLTNVVKHARASRVTVAVTRVNGRLRIEVTDDGAGFAPSTWHARSPVGFGLFNTRERLEHLGGRFEISSSPGVGTRAALTAPVGLPKASPPTDRRPSPRSGRPAAVRRARRR